MARAGCVELRFGIESGCNEILERVSKGFTVEEATKTVADAVKIFPGVDTFFIWGFPFETMEQFYQTVFLMSSYRMMGTRVQVLSNAEPMALAKQTAATQEAVCAGLAPTACAAARTSAMVEP